MSTIPDVFLWLACWRPPIASAAWSAPWLRHPKACFVCRAHWRRYRTCRRLRWTSPTGWPAVAGSCLLLRRSRLRSLLWPLRRRRSCIRGSTAAVGIGVVGRRRPRGLGPCWSRRCSIVGRAAAERGLHAIRRGAGIAALHLGRRLHRTGRWTGSTRRRQRALHPASHRHNVPCTFALLLTRCCSRAAPCGRLVIHGLPDLGIIARVTALAVQGFGGGRRATRRTLRGLGIELVQLGPVGTRRGDRALG